MNKTSVLALGLLVSAVWSLAGCMIEPKDSGRSSYGGNCSTRYDNSLDADVVQRKSLQIERHLQRVNRYDCFGDLVSSELETVKSPRADFSIEAFSLGEENQDLSFWAYNRTTCEPGQSTRLSEGSNPRKKWITADTSPAVFTTRVLEGENYFDYEFSACQNNPDDNSPNNCLKSAVLEKGTMIVDVIYSEKRLHGSKEIYPMNCQ